MNTIESYSRFPSWVIVLLLSVLAAGCGGGGGSGSAAGTILGAPAGAVVPGATSCTVAAGATIPTVISSDPTSGNQVATTSTNGVAGGGKLITATFSLAMDPATINATTFTLTPSGGAILVPASVNYNASTKVATLTTSSALAVDTVYTAIVTQGATSAAGVTIACSFAWNFKTAATVATGLAPVNLGLVATFGSAATAGVTNTGTAPNTIINGDIVLDPVAGAKCNSVTVDAAGGFGLCNGFAPTINGTVISPLFNLGVTSTS
ncbi:MAG TPA: Ig-like domain-containing protein, partial [Gemmataceae bacterium]|nr:Ig-like domain-containing protein [Gemmataceae bacterium]